MVGRAAATVTRIARAWPGDRKLVPTLGPVSQRALPASHLASLCVPCVRACLTVETDEDERSKRGQQAHLAKQKGQAAVFFWVPLFLTGHLEPTPAQLGITATIHS